MVEPEQQLIAATKAGIKHHRLAVQLRLFAKQPCQGAACVRIACCGLPITQIAPGLAFTIERQFCEIVKFGHRSGCRRSAGFPGNGCTQMFGHRHRGVDRSLEQRNFLGHIGAAQPERVTVGRVKSTRASSRFGAILRIGFHVWKTVCWPDRRAIALVRSTDTSARLLPRGT